MKRKRVDKEIEIPVVLDNSEKTPPTNTEIKFAMERYRVFARSLFGDDYEVGAIKINKGREDPSKITMLRVQREFILAQKARGNSKETIRAYETNFNRLYDFLGFQYAKQSKEVLNDILENPDKNESSRTIGASLPVLVFELQNFMAFYQDYLTNVCELSPYTVVSSIRHVKAIIYFTQERGWVREYGIKVKELKPEIKDTFTQTELTRLGKKPRLRSDNFVEYRTWVMIQYLSATGNRIGSVLALNVNDIDFENGTIRINLTKNNEPKLMPLIYELRKVLLDYIMKCRTDDDRSILYNEPLFSNQDGVRLSYTGARDAFKDYFEARDVEWCGFHKFRHSYAANWIRDGGNPFMLKEQLGHSSLAMTNRYANIYVMATKKEAEEHSLTNKLPKRARGKRIRIKD